MSPLQAENLLSIPKISHGFMTRNGGVSSGVYASANFAINKKDSEINVQENKKILLKSFGGVYSNIFLLSQKHTNKIVPVDDNWEEKVQQNSGILEADGLISERKGILIGVLTADCVPLLMSTADGKWVAAVHVGWRGALEGIIENAVSQLRKFSPDDEIVAAVGPCIQQHNFEVGPDLVSAFHQKYMSSKGFFLRKENRTYFNLEGFVRFRLQDHDIHNITLTHIDTYSRPDQFFSYRRSCHKGEDGCGCQVSVIGIQRG